MTRAHRPSSIASQATGLDRFIAYGAALIIVVHLVSLTIPALQVERLLFFNDTITIWGAIAELFRRGEWAVATVLVAFTILFPLLKLVAIIHLYLSPGLKEDKLERHLLRLERLGKWSMLDVMVAALLVVSFTATGLADARFLPGMYLFALAVVGALLLSSRITRLARGRGEAAKQQ